MAWIQPIYDRTTADVDYARANRGTQPPLKGAISAPDWARITGNIHFIADFLASYGYKITVNCTTAWARTDFPTRTRIQTIRDDIERLQTGFARFASCPMLSWNTHEKINQVERILLEVRSMVEHMVRTFPRSGNFIYSGAYYYMITE